MISPGEPSLVVGALERALSATLSPIGIDALAAPERLPWLVLALAVGAASALRRRAPALLWPGTAEASQAGARRIEWTPTVAVLLRTGALACLALVLAQPVAVRTSPPEPGHGLDLMLVVDTSASMRALDVSAASVYASAPGDRFTTRTRLDLAKQVVSRFAERRVARGDRVGLVVFGSTAFTQCPLTSDGALLAAALRRVEVGVAGEATALGDALALAVKRAPQRASTGGRVIVLLTDGRSSAGAVPVDIAAALASGEGIRVHTVGIGTAGGQVPVPARSGPDPPLRLERHDTDPETLQRIARATGGSYFAATHTADLQAVYREVDGLERPERPLPPRVQRSLHSEPLLAGAAGLLALEILLAGIVRRRLP